MKHRIDRLAETHRLTREDCLALLRNRDEDTTAYLKKKAVAVRKQYFGNAVYVRGLIEFTIIAKMTVIIVEFAGAMPMRYGIG